MGLRRITNRCTQMSDQEKRALDSFKRTLNARGLLPLPPRMCHCGDEESTLLRYLNARKLDVKKAEQMIEETINFRKENKMDELLEHQDDPELTKKLRMAQPNAYHGEDYEGRPLYLECTGNIDAESIISMGVENVKRLHLSAMEFLMNILCREASAKQGRVVDKVTAVMDASGLNLKKARKLLSGNIFSTLSKIDSDHYPETMARTIVINAPRVANFIFNLASPFLDPKTRSKIVIVSEKSSRNVLSRYVDLKYIPASMGGDGDDDDLRNIGQEATTTQALAEVLTEENARLKRQGERTYLEELEQRDKARQQRMLEMSYDDDDDAMTTRREDMDGSLNADEIDENQFDPEVRDALQSMDRNIAYFSQFKRKQRRSEGERSREQRYSYQETPDNERKGSCTQCCSVM